MIKLRWLSLSFHFYPILNFPHYQFLIAKKINFSINFNLKTISFTKWIFVTYMNEKDTFESTCCRSLWTQLFEHAAVKGLDKCGERSWLTNQWPTKRMKEYHNGNRWELHPFSREMKWTVTSSPDNKQLRSSANLRYKCDGPKLQILLVFINYTTGDRTVTVFIFSENKNRWHKYCLLW